MAVHGSVAPGFERVRRVFEQNFASGNEVGTPSAFGTPGAGGSLGFADPEHKLGFTTDLSVERARR